MINLPYRPCVGIMLVNSCGAVFAGQRLDGIAEAWQMPQGGIDEGEETLTAALRELEEETGITSDQVKFLARSQDWLCYDLPSDLVSRLWGGKFRGQKQMWFLFRFIGVDSQIDIKTRHPEFKSWQWMSTDSIVTKIVPFKRAVYRSVITEFRDVIEAHVATDHDPLTGPGC